MNGEPILNVVFFCSHAGLEPVREWLKSVDKVDRKAIGEDIKLVQFRWPLGMPLVRKIEADLWEVRSNLIGGRIARVRFAVISLVGALREYCLLLEEMRWHYCTASLRNLKRHPKEI